MRRACLLISLAAGNRLATAGLSPGWLAAWMRSAGYAETMLKPLESEVWGQPAGHRIIIGQAKEVMHIQEKLEAYSDYTLTEATLHSHVFRCRNSGYKTFLTEVNEVVCRRNRWLSALAGGCAPAPLHVWMGSSDRGMELEPGLYGDTVAPPSGALLLNSEGLLPEEQLLHMLGKRKLRVRFAESCTAGGMCERLSRVAGASDVLDRGWVVYSNQSKQEVLSVPESLLHAHGAVSREAVDAMARAGVDDYTACVAVSGIAGPAGGTPEKPVGTVWIAIALPHSSVVSRLFHFDGARAEVRVKSILAGFAMLIRALSD